MRILAIDDDPNFLFLIELMLKKAGIQAHIESFSNAELALKVIESQTPNLIFLDLFMPVMNRWDFIQQLESKSIHINVYFLSSSVDQSDQTKALSFHTIKDFLSKPLRFKSRIKLFH